MPIKPDVWIRKNANELGMIEPLAEKQERGGISYGVGSYGYDFRIGNTFKIFQPKAGSVIDPKKIDDAQFVEHIGE